MKAIYLVLTVIFLLGIGSCKNKTAPKDAAVTNFEALLKSNKEAANIEKEQKLLKKLGGTELYCLNTIIAPLKNEDANIVLVISEEDCPDCVVAGYAILQRIKEAKGVIKTYASGITKEVTIPKDYGETVYEDEKNELHAALYYAPTPIILVLEGSRIIDLHTPENAESEHSRNFINEYLY